jgi:hypothetical protein
MRFIFGAAFRCGVLLVFGIGLGLVGAMRQGQSPAFARGEPPAFAPSLHTLQRPGEYCTWYVETRGCFGGNRYEYRYTPLPTPRLLVTDHTPQIRLDKKTNKVTVARQSRSLAAVTLNPAQVTRLDNLLRYLRKRKKGGCTTVDTIKITWYINSQPAREEKFINDTCAYNLNDADPRDLKTLGIAESPTLSLSLVNEAAITGKAKGKSVVPYPEPLRAKTQAYMEARYREEDRRSRADATNTLKKLPGYAEMQREFVIEQEDQAEMMFLGPCFSATLTPRIRTNIDSIDWSSPAKRKRPTTDWKQFLVKYQAIDTTIASRPWIRDWKNLSKGRTIEAEIHSNSEIADSSEDIQQYAGTAWKHAGLRGMPQYKIMLRRPDRTWVTLYLNEEESRTLVASCYPAKTDKTSHLLDSLRLSYHHTQKMPEYAVVTTDGKMERNTRPR